MDALADHRARYNVAPGVIHLDGTSAGALPTATATPTRLNRFGQRRGSHLSAPSGPHHDWRPQARLAAERIATLVGADSEELTVSESTSMNLFQALLSAARLRPERPILVLDRECFANDHYLARSAADFTGCELRLLEDLDQLPEILGDQVALVALSHTDLISGAVRDSAAITTEIHRNGALALWGLNYSTGALPVDLHRWDADFAIGCGSRYLGGGSGAPAYSFVAQRHHAQLQEAVGQHETPYRNGVLNPLSAELVIPSALSLSHLRDGLSILDGVDHEELAAKTAALVALFLRRLRDQCTEIDVVAPPRGAARGSQVSLRHPDAQQLTEGLFARGIITDFVEPDLLRFSFAPAWLRYVDVWDAADELHGVLGDKARRSSRASA